MNLKQQIYHALVDHHRRFGQVPQRDELQQSFYHNADGTVDACLAALAREGLILLSGETPGHISLADAVASPAVEVGIQGYMVPGRGTITLDLSGIGLPLGDETHALRVADDLMTDAGIQTGDIAILKPGVPLRGDIVAAIIDDRLVLRRFLVIRGIPHLLAENPGRPDLRAAFDTQLQGVLCALLRVDFGRTRQTVPDRATVSYSAEKLPPAARSAAHSGRTKPSKNLWAQPPSGFALNEPSAGFDAKAKKKRRIAAGKRKRSSGNG